MNAENVKPEEQSASTITELDNNLPTVLTTPDEDQLIEETITSIGKIYGEARKTTIITIGELLFEKIYENDPSCVSNDKSIVKTQVKKRLVFEQLANRTNELIEKGEFLPKKTFLYNAVKLVALEKLLCDSPEYKQLSISHKIGLLSIDDKDKKLLAAKEILTQDLSVRDARIRVSLLQNKRAKKTSIKYYINNPGKIENEPDFFKEIIGVYNTEEKKTTVINDCERKITEINTQIVENQESIGKLKTLMQQVKKGKIRKSRKKKGTEKPS